MVCGGQKAEPGAAWQAHRDCKTGRLSALRAGCERWLSPQHVRHTAGRLVDGAGLRNMALWQNAPCSAIPPFFRPCSRHHVHRLQFQRIRLTLRTRPIAIGHVRAFLAVARHLNFRAAAEELALTQSAVSRQIQGLEDEVGCPCFCATPVPWS
jgi:hypothetical protein